MCWGEREKVVAVESDHKLTRPGQPALGLSSQSDWESTPPSWAPTLIKRSGKTKTIFLNNRLLQLFLRSTLAYACAVCAVAPSGWSMLCMSGCREAWKAVNLLCYALDIDKGCGSKQCISSSQKWWCTICDFSNPFSNFNRCRQRLKSWSCRNDCCVKGDNIISAPYLLKAKLLRESGWDDGNLLKNKISPG